MKSHWSIAPQMSPYLRNVDTDVLMCLLCKICFWMWSLRKRTKLAVVYLNVSFKKESLNYLLKTFVLWILLKQALYPEIQHISHKKFKCIVRNGYIHSYCNYVAFNGVTSETNAVWLFTGAGKNVFFQWILLSLSNAKFTKLPAEENGAENGCNTCIFLLLC